MAAGGEPRRLRPPASWLHLIPDEEPTPSSVERYAAYIEHQLGDLANAETRLQIDRLKVRLADRLYKELNAGGPLLPLVRLFLAGLDRVKERELDIEPPELVEHIFVRDPSPNAVSARQAMGFFLDTDEG